MSTAFVYNGFKPMTLVYAGLPYHFPFNEVTQVPDQRFTSPDERRRNHESNPENQAIFESKVDGIEFAVTLMNRHYQGYHTEGVVWIGTQNPAPPHMIRAKELGRIKKMKIVEQSLADRRQALAKGGQPELDEEIVGWMKDYGIYDDLYHQKPSENGNLSDAQLAQVGAIAGAVIAKLQQPRELEPVGAKK